MRVYTSGIYVNRIKVRFNNFQNFVNSCTSGSIVFKIADHLPIFCIVYYPQNNPFPEKIEIRDFKVFKQCQFRSELSPVNLKPVFNSHKVND